MYPLLRQREREVTSQYHAGAFQRTVSSTAAVWGSMRMDNSLHCHRGCVNHVSFNETGTLLLSGSDDMRVGVWDVQQRRLKAAVQTSHTQNIFCVRFLPASSDGQAVSCAGDGEVQIHNLERLSHETFRYHTGRVKKLLVEPGNPNLIISGSEDGTVRQLDRRVPNPAEHAITLSHMFSSTNSAFPASRGLEVNSIAMPYDRPWLVAIGGTDETLRICDRRRCNPTGSIKSVACFSPKSHHSSFASDCITGVAFSNDGREVLANYLSDHVYLYSLSGLSLKYQHKRSEEDSPERLWSDLCAEGSGEAVQQRERLGLARVVELLENDELRLPRRRRRAVAEKLAAASERLHGMGQMEGALRYAEAAARLSPTLGRAYYCIAAAHESMAHFDQARAALQTALQFCWNQELSDMQERLRLPGEVPAPPSPDSDSDSDPGMQLEAPAQPFAYQPAALRGNTSSGAAQPSLRQLARVVQSMRADVRHAGSANAAVQLAAAPVPDGSRAVVDAEPSRGNGFAAQPRPTGDAPSSGASGEAAPTAGIVSSPVTRSRARARPAEPSTAQRTSMAPQSSNGPTRGRMSHTRERVHTGPAAATGDAGGGGAPTLQPAQAAARADTLPEGEQVRVPTRHRASSRSSAEASGSGQQQGASSTQPANRPEPAGAEPGPAVNARVTRRRLAAGLDARRTGAATLRRLAGADGDIPNGASPNDDAHGDITAGSAPGSGPDADVMAGADGDAAGGSAARGGLLAALPPPAAGSASAAGDSTRGTMAPAGSAGTAGVDTTAGAAEPASAAAAGAAALAAFLESRAFLRGTMVPMSRPAAGAPALAASTETLTGRLAAINAQANQELAAAHRQARASMRALPDTNVQLNSLPRRGGGDAGGSESDQEWSPPSENSSNPELYPEEDDFDMDNDDEDGFFWRNGLDESDDDFLADLGQDDEGVMYDWGWRGIQDECESAADRVEDDDGPLYRLGRELIRGEASPAADQASTSGSASGSGSAPWAMRYRGACNMDTIKDVAFLGPACSVVAAGSDGGHLFMWDKGTGRLLAALRGDGHVVNCIHSHPYEPLMASCGIDYSVKIWTPSLSGYAKQLLPANRTRLAGLAAMNELQRRKPVPAWASGSFATHEAYHLQPPTVRASFNERAGRVLGEMHAERHRRQYSAFNPMDTD